MAASGNLGAQAVIAFDIGLRLTGQDQRLWGIKRWPANHLAIDQPVQQVQHMGLGGQACRQGHFHGGQHSLLIVVQDERKDIDHLTITTGAAQYLVLQLSEWDGKFEEWCAVAQCSRLALDDRKIVPPIINRLRWQFVAALDHADMFAQDIALCRHDQPVRIDPQADGAVRKRCAGTVAPDGAA